MPHTVNDSRRDVLLNSQTAEMQRLQDSTQVHEPPPGIELKPGVERMTWDYIMRNKAKADWSPVDLLQAAKVAQLEAFIREGYAELDAHPALHRFVQGTDAFILNKGLMQAEKHQLTLMRGIGVTRTSMRGDAGSTHKRAAQERDAAEDLADDGLPAFLAKP